MQPGATRSKSFAYELSRQMSELKVFAPGSARNTGGRVLFGSWRKSPDISLNSPVKSGGVLTILAPARSEKPRSAVDDHAVRKNLPDFVIAEMIERVTSAERVNPFTL